MAHLKPRVVVPEQHEAITSLSHLIVSVQANTNKVLGVSQGVFFATRVGVINSHLPSTIDFVAITLSLVPDYFHVVRPSVKDVGLLFRITNHVCLLRSIQGKDTNTLLVPKG
jgi:hypothetical protein